jgi:hypothetical protein
MLHAIPLTLPVKRASVVVIAVMGKRRIGKLWNCGSPFQRFVSRRDKYNGTPCQCIVFVGARPFITKIGAIAPQI